LNQAEELSHVVKELTITNERLHSQIVEQKSMIADSHQELQDLRSAMEQ
jgi:hypothetical protein